MESPIHYPTDSQLISDSIRVLTRWLRRLARRHGIVVHDHRCRAKRRCMNIRNHRGARRRAAYRDLLKVARKTAHYTRMALRQAHRWTDLPSQVMAGKLRYYLDLLERFIDQTELRVLRGESAPASEKVVSGQSLLFTLSTPCLTLPKPQKPDFPGENKLSSAGVHTQRVQQRFTIRLEGTWSQAILSLVVVVNGR